MLYYILFDSPDKVELKMDKENLGRLIYLLRTEKKLSQTAFAKDLHVTASSVCKWEQGQTFPDVIMLETIADYFELSMDDLYHPRQTLARVFDHSMD